jgi:hypothetical protein
LKLTKRVADGRLTIEKRSDVARRLQQMVKGAAGKKSLAAALIID